MECQICGSAPVLQGNNTLNVYDIRCNTCRLHYCGVCGLTPSHFPSLCRERSQWQRHFMQRDEEFVLIYNQMRDYNRAKAGMLAWRDVIGHNVYDEHAQMRFAVEEMTTVLGIRSWSQVAFRYNQNMEARVNLTFTRMNNAYNALRNHFINYMDAVAAGEQPEFEVADARDELGVSTHNYISKLRSLRAIQAIPYPGHVDQNLANYSLNVDRALRSWVLNPMR